MSFQELLKWWAGFNPRVPLPGGIVADYAAMAGRYNRSLISKFFVPVNAATNPADTNRVGLYIYCRNILPSTGLQIQTGVRILQADGVTVAFGSSIAEKEADVALV